MNNPKMDKVKPIAPAAGYIGGKRNLARRICALIDGLQHDGYAEPFVGMGGIFLRRSTQPKAEVINDITIRPISAARTTAARTSSPARTSSAWPIAFAARAARS